MIPTRRTGPWRLSDLASIKTSGLRVFSCFHCGGGSTMGYKLAGFDVLGGVEIDRHMMAVYKANHDPQHAFEMSIADFNQIDASELSPDLTDLDVLDGSPPCSSFSMAGARQRKWGEEHAFREGQATQVLDDLFGHFIETARILRPKVVVAENVRGMILGKARGYVAEIFRLMQSAGYRVQLFLLNAASMGVPQRRERVFFIARRLDLEWPDLQLQFDEEPIALQSAIDGAPESPVNWLTEETKRLWRRCRRDQDLSTVHPTGARFNIYKGHPDRVCRTLCAKETVMHWSEPRWLTGREFARVATFPDDFNYGGSSPVYLTGMSVPPFMMQRVALELRRQWLG